MFTYEKPEQKQKSKSTIQKKETEKPATAPNLTGRPHVAKTNFESTPGFSFADVNVHYNSDKPSQFKPSHRIQDGAKCEVVQREKCKYCKNKHDHHEECPYNPSNREEFIPAKGDSFVTFHEEKDSSILSLGSVNKKDKRLRGPHDDGPMIDSIYSGAKVGLSTIKEGAHKGSLFEEIESGGKKATHLSRGYPKESPFTPQGEKSLESRILHVSEKERGKEKTTLSKLQQAKREARSIFKRTKTEDDSRKHDAAVGALKPVAKKANEELRKSIPFAARKEIGWLTEEDKAYEKEKKFNPHSTDDLHPSVPPWMKPPVKAALPSVPEVYEGEDDEDFPFIDNPNDVANMHDFD